MFIKVAKEVWKDKGFRGDQAILKFLYAHGISGLDAVALWTARAGGTLWTPLVEAAVLGGQLPAPISVRLSTSYAATETVIVKSGSGGSVHEAELTQGTTKRDVYLCATGTVVHNTKTSKANGAGQYLGTVLALRLLSGLQRRLGSWGSKIFASQSSALRIRAAHTELLQKRMLPLCVLPLHASFINWFNATCMALK